MKQSPNDHKQYFPFTLENGLRVLAVHNKDTQKSAAALAVNVGHFSDPIDRQGLAHFLEHMLFLGTKNYPDGSEYQKFISQYGGSNNAWTATEHTCFFFDIHHQHFEPALDRFSQFFISPLLSEEFVNKERKNIDAEFKLKLKDDIRRLYDVHKETINPEHPFAKFSVGNTETLSDRPGKHLRDEVEDFFLQHYVAKAMTLVIEGPQSLEILQQLAVDKFSDISSNDISQRKPDIPLYLPEHQQICLQVKPVKNDRQLILSFAMPSIDEFYREKPESLISYLMGHEGPHSILSLLKKNQWALGLTAGSGVNGYNFKDFNISIRLTQAGEKQVDEIISIVFSYIYLLKQAPLAEYYYQEKKQIAELSFHYHEKMKPLDSVSQLVINMQHYPQEDYIFGDYVMENMNQQQLTNLLNYLTPENMRTIYINKNVPTDKVSRWYQVPYQVEKIAKNQINKWRECQLHQELALPPKNKYIVEKPKLYGLKKPDNSLTPQLFKQENGLQFWYKQDHTFNVPKGYIYLGIDSPKTLENETNIAMTRLFVDLYTESVIEKHYDAELAGIHYHLYSHQGGLTLQLSGVSENQGFLLKQLLAELQMFSFSEEIFHLMKQHLINHWKNADNSKSISQLFSVLSSTMQPKCPSSETLANALINVDFQQFNDFCHTIFNEINLDVLVHGNWREQDAAEIHSIIKQAFNGQYAQQHQVKIPVLNIKDQASIQYPLHLPEHDYAGVIYYPMEERSLLTVAKTMIASQILSPQFFHQMRTEKQYGYLVGVGFVPINRYPGIAFYIQSPNFEANLLLEAMDEFINECHLVVENMPEADWQHLQHGLASQLQEKDTSLRIKSQRFWTSICNKETDFKQKQHLIETILSLSKTDISEFLFSQITNNQGVIDRFCLLSTKQPKEEQNSNTSLNDSQLLEYIFKNCSIKY
ncbi:insulinase family protein [Colwellia sp. 1_MG-2023]|uniref:insulinase family protein n=1 Tax=Colwellia sp. 1_MG-2023 TaxID=3062649 RepID=UPI0026E320DE|nr:insulinase family protein [Colwellia sp. 1_MG-2023]MDO6444279.1 insulinase family protein [Colwellia sp. 1_MG-2023]